MSALALGLTGTLCISTTVAADAPRTAFTAQDLNTLKRLSDPQVSPDGLRVAYALRSTDLAANRGRSDLWLLDLSQPLLDLSNVQFSVFSALSFD
jgi:hypothetical protein